MTKILLVANTDWYLYRYRLSLARYLRRRGFEPVLVSPPGKYVSRVIAEGFRWLEWQIDRQSSHFFTELSSMFSLWRIFHRERPALVHLHTIKPVLYGSLAARLAGVPGIVRSITGRGYVFISDERRARHLRFIVKHLYRFLQTGVTIFENEADLRFFLEQNMVCSTTAHLIEGVGVDTDYFSPLPEPEGTPLVLFASRLLWDKGVGVLVEAARILHTRLKLRVVLAGEPDTGNPASIPLETLHAWQSEGVVEWWGWQEDMRPAYAACHLVTLPSFGEGLPTTLLEAGACGRAVVATDVAGCRDVVEDGVNGLLVPPGDAQALAKAIEHLLCDSALRRRMGLAGRQRVEERFSDNLINARTLEVYASLLK